MSEKLTDPRPAATEAAMSDAELIDAFETTVIHNSRTWDADIQSRIGATRVELLRRLARTAAAPPSGLGVSEQTRQTALAVLTERANEYTDAQEMSPHYGTTATIGTPWDSAIAELAALKGAAR
jgi:hypothetical protein